MTTVWLIVFWVALALLIYLQIGYPVVVFLLSRLIQAKEPGSFEPRASLIIPAHNEETVIRSKLENSLALDYPVGKLEILVASDGSSDRTVEIAREYEDQGIKVNGVIAL